MLLKIFLTKLLIFIIFMIDISFSFSLLAPIPITLGNNYTFTLKESTKYVIYFFKNEMSTNNNLVLHFNNTPTYDIKLFLYFSETNESQNIESIIKYNNQTGIFFDAFYSTNLNILKDMNYEIILNSSNCGIQCFTSGYIYAVIGIFSTDINSEFTSEFIAYTKQYLTNIKNNNHKIEQIKEYEKLEEKMIRKTYYNNEASNMDIYKLLEIQEENIENIKNYFIYYQGLYGNFEGNYIILDDINIHSIDELTYFNYSEGYSLSEPAILGKYVLTHIKIKSNKTVPSAFDHIALYENILKINSSYSEKVGEGEVIILFPELGKPTYIYFEPPYNEFNLEIKYLGKEDSGISNINADICEDKGINLNSKNKLFRGKCKKSGVFSKIALINNGTSLTGVIISRVIPKEKFNRIISDSIYEYYLDKKLVLIKFDKGLKNLYLFLIELKINWSDKYCSIYQEYSDIEYISFPSNYVMRMNTIKNLNLSVDNEIIYGENNCKGRIIDSDYLFIILDFREMGGWPYLDFVRQFKIYVDNEKDYIYKGNNDKYFYIMPKNNELINYNSMFFQVFNGGYFAFYKNLEMLFEIRGEGNYEFLDASTIDEKAEFWFTISYIYSYLFRFKLYNSYDDNYRNYNYLNNLISENKLKFQVKDNKTYPVKIEIIPSKPHENNGCSNYFFFILDHNNNYNIDNYYKFKILDSSDYYQNFSAKNICSSNGEFLENDLYKFTFPFKLKKSAKIQYLGYSEQVNHYKAIKFYVLEKYNYEYEDLDFLSVNFQLNKNKLYILDEEFPDILKIKIEYGEEGLLNIFWKGSDINKIQEVLLYNNFEINSQQLIYNSTNISKYEHNFSIKVNSRNKNIFIYNSIDDIKNRTIYFDFTNSLGKEFGFNSEQNKYQNWIIYTSGIYKFFTKIDKADLKLNAFRYRLKNNNYDSISSIKLFYLNENENIIKSFKIQGNAHKKFIDSENKIFYYFTLLDDIGGMIEKQNLYYIQIEFELKFSYKGNYESLDELAIERIRIEKIEDKT